MDAPAISADGEATMYSLCKEGVLKSSCLATLLVIHCHYVNMSKYVCDLKNGLEASLNLSLSQDYLKVNRRINNVTSDTARDVPRSVFYRVPSIKTVFCPVRVPN